MAADLDLSPEAVERLAKRHALHVSSKYPTAATLRALAAENARLRAERDAAWQAGAVAMQKVAARTAVATPATRSDKAGVVWHDGFTSGCLHAADAIRALPLPGQTKETSHAAGAAMGTLLRETVLPILRRSAEDLFRCVSIRNVPDSVSPADWRDIAEDMEAVLAVEAFVGRPDDEYGRTLNPILDARMWEAHR